MWNLGEKRNLISVEPVCFGKTQIKQNGIIAPLGQEVLRPHGHVEAIDYLRSHRRYWLRCRCIAFQSLT